MKLQVLRVSVVKMGDIISWSRLKTLLSRSRQQKTLVQMEVMQICRAVAARSRIQAPVGAMNGIAKSWKN
jgi:hypothetical protein